MRSTPFCVNTIPASTAAERAGDFPFYVNWVAADGLVPEWLYPHVSDEMAEGVAWKLAPVRLFPTFHEISLDNDVILWAIPPSMEQWLTTSQSKSCLLAADVGPGLGQFSAICSYRALNAGIRGLPPGFDMESKLRQKSSETGTILQSELDEQGLQVAVLLDSDLNVVSTEDVSLCSPFPNHMQHLGRCGAHFVGLNPKWLPWVLNGRGAHEAVLENWKGYATELSRLVPEAGLGRPPVVRRSREFDSCVRAELS